MTAPRRGSARDARRRAQRRARAVADGYAPMWVWWVVRVETRGGEPVREWTVWGTRAEAEAAGERVARGARVWVAKGNRK